MASQLSKVEHVVVLMLENRSFDHLLGYMKAVKPAVDGLNGTESIPADPTVPGSPPVPVTSLAGDAEPDPDAGHELEDVSEQMYGHEDLSFPAGGPMNGFVVNYGHKTASPAGIMNCVNPTRIPALGTLVQQFCVCNRWYSSVPGPTWPNRLFVHAGTSGGHVTNDLTLYFLPTIFHRLEKAGLSWRIYYHDIPQSLLFFSLWDDFLDQLFTKRFRTFDRWGSDLSGPTCRLPTYTFIEPRYFSLLNIVEANDQHPSHHIAMADRLVNDVYTKLRNSPCWAHSLLVIVHDEHGGTHDDRFPGQPAVNPELRPHVDSGHARAALRPDAAHRPRCRRQLARQLPHGLGPAVDHSAGAASAASSGDGAHDRSTSPAAFRVSARARRAGPAGAYPR